MAGLILASRSPQRSAILRELGIDFEVIAAEVEELEQGAPHDLAVENAFRKAAAVAGRASERVLGVDTVVCLDGHIYGKPEGPAQARATLRALSGRVHTVVSGLCLLERSGPRTAAESTSVEFRALDPRLIEWYVESGEWRDRAGGYAIQARGGALVRRIEGDYLNVVGLPVGTLLELAPDLIGT